MSLLLLSVLILYMMICLLHDDLSVLILYVMICLS